MTLSQNYLFVSIRQITPPAFTSSADVIDGVMRIKILWIGACVSSAAASLA
jgi:hypothetical protein